MDITEFFYTNFIEVWEFEFFREALISGLLASIVTAVLSFVIVNKNWAMMGMGLSNSVFPGVVIGSQFSFPFALTLGAISTGLLCTYLTAYIITHSKLRNETVLGICYSCFFALGVLSLSFIDTESHITHILFGNILGIEEHAYIELQVISILVLLFVVLRFKDIVLFTFDETQFEMQGLNLKHFSNIILVIITLTIIVSLQAIGILLTISFLVLPAVTAQQLTNKLSRAVFLAILVNMLSCYGGITLAYIYDITTGPSIVVGQTLLFLSAFVWRKLYHAYKQKTVKLIVQ